MKRRDQSLLNYTLFIVVVVALGFYINTQNHDYPINLAALQTSLDQSVSKLNMTLNFNLPSQIQNEKREKLRKTLDDLFKKQFYLEFDSKINQEETLIKNAKFGMNLIKKNKIIDRIEQILTYYIINRVDLICEERNKSIQIISTQQIKYYAGNTCENFSLQYLKELRRVILTFSSNLLEYSYEKRFYDKDIFFNLYFYFTFDSTSDSANQLKTLKKLISEQILKFSSSLSISKEQIRVNLKTIHPDEFTNLNVNQVLSNEKPDQIQFSVIKNLHNQLKGNYHNRINFRDYYNRQVVFFLNQVDEVKITNQEESQGYFLNYEDDLFISANINNISTIQTIFNRALIELYDLSDIYLLSDSLQNTELDLNLKTISTYFLKREYFCTYQAIYNQINTIINLRQIRYIIFDEHSTKLIDSWLAQTEQILKLKYNQNKTFQEQVYKQDDLNKIDEIGQLDYFSNDYYMGVYLPIIIPVAYPYILGVLGVNTFLFLNHSTHFQKKQKIKEIKQSKKSTN